MANDRQAFYQLMGNLSNILGQRRAEAMQQGQFGAQMQMQQAGMQMQQQQWETAQAFREAEAQRQHEEWQRGYEIRKAESDKTIEKINAVLGIMKDEEKRTAMLEEAKTIMGAEAALPGVSKYTTPEQWAEHPGIVEAGLSGTVLGMGEQLKGFLPDETKKLREATLIYDAAQRGIPWETLGFPEEYRNIYDTSTADRERGIRRDEAQIKSMLRGPVGPAPPEAGLVQGRAMANFESVVVAGGDPTDELWMAAFGYIPETLDEKQAIIFQTIENYKSRYGTVKERAGIE